MNRRVLSHRDVVVLDAADVKPDDARGEVVERQRRSQTRVRVARALLGVRGGRRRITQTDIDFLCLGVFGARALPDDMAERIAARRELAEGITAAFARHPEFDLEPDRVGSTEAAALEVAV